MVGRRELDRNFPFGHAGVVYLLQVLAVGECPCRLHSIGDPCYLSYLGTHLVVCLY